LTAALALLVAVFGADSEGAGPAPPEPVVHVVFEDVVRLDPEEGAKGPDGTKALPRKDTTRLDVWLGSRDFAVAASEGSEVYDFGKLRIHRWTSDGAESESGSMVGVIDGRLQEFEHRLKLAGMLRSMKKEMPCFGPINLETLFGVETEPGKWGGQITSREVEGTREFLAGGEILCRVALERRTLAPGFRETWIRFLRHEVPLHPAVLSAVGREAGLPVHLESRWLDPGLRKSRTLRLVTIEDAVGKFPVPPPLRPSVKEPIDRALAAGAMAVPPSREAKVKAAEDLRKSGHPVDAFLGLMDFTIATGKPISSEIQTLLADPAAKEAVTEVLSRLGAPTSAEDGDARADWLQARKASGYRNSHMLDIFSAGLLLRTGDAGAARARDLLLGVVGEHPELAGAWHDLGLIYRERFEGHLAWKCWEVALRLAPDHGILEDVRRIRAGLLKDHPEFFR
jgi:hypothetical protein